MGRRVDRVLLGIEILGGLAIIVGMIDYIISELSKIDYVRDPSAYFIGIFMLILVILYGFIFWKMKSEEYYAKYKLPIRCFVWGILTTFLIFLLIIPLGFFLMNLTRIGIGMQYLRFLIYFGVIDSLVLSLFFFVFKLSQVDLKSYQVILIVFIMTLIIGMAFWPKPCGTHSSVVGGDIEVCRCLGSKTSDGMMGGGKVYCIGYCLGDSCHYERLEPVSLKS